MGSDKTGKVDAFLRPITRFKISFGTTDVRGRNLTSQIGGRTQNLQRNVFFPAVLLFQVIRNKFARKLLACVVVVFAQFIDDFFFILKAGQDLSITSTDGTTPSLSQLSLPVLAELVTVEDNELVTSLTEHCEEHGGLAGGF